jgi:hypothetical protein
MFSSIGSAPSHRQTVIRGMKRDVLLVLLLKTAIILTAAFTIFGASQRLFVDAGVMTDQLMR